MRAAVTASLLLGLVSFALLWAANEATDRTAIAGGIGLVVAGALLGLSILALRWDRERVRRYVQTSVEPADRTDAVAITGPRERAARDSAAG